MLQNYTPTEWIDNRTVGTAKVMNNIENGIKDAHDRIDGVDSQIKDKANLDEVVKKGYATLNDFNDETRKAILENNSIDINYVLGIHNVLNENLANNSVDYSKVDFFNTYTSVNVLDKSKVTIGYMISSKGEITTHETGGITDYIKVFPGDVIRTTSTWEGAFFDSDKNYISGNEFGDTEIVAPEGARYYRQSINATYHLDTSMITINNALPDSYVKFLEYSEPTKDFADKIMLIMKSSTIKADDTDFFINSSENLFNKNTVTNKHIVDDNGNLISHDTGCVSDYISVKADTTYYINQNWNGAFYDSNKNFISLKDFGLTEFITPENCCFIRLSLNEIHKDSYMLSLTPITTYVDYLDTLRFKNNNDLLSIAQQLLDTSLFLKDDYKGKKWIALGDSLTEANIRTTKHYHTYIAEETGITVVNMGVGGTGYKRQEENNKAFYQRVKDIPNDFDLITIFGSGNDLGLGINKLGNPTDTTTDTICGCINTTIDKIYEVKVDAKIGIITPCPWGNYNPIDPNNSMAKYSNALVEICKLRGIPVLDLYRSSNMRPWDENFRELYYKRDDGNYVHPDEDGHREFLYKRILSFIQSII